MVNEISLSIAKIEVQKVIVKLLYENNDIALNQYNLIVSKLDKKIQSINRKNGEIISDLNPIVLNIKL